MNFQNSGNLLASRTHQLRFLESENSDSIYMTFSVFLDDACLDYSNFLAENNAKFSEVVKMLDVSPAECQKSLSI